jgi:prepilin-type N-terminal cleavage/methylation domain-containing protein
MRTRRGFTLIEVMISVTLLLVIMGAAVQFLRRQTQAVSMETERMDALSNAEYAASQIERELREAGAGVADYQPMIVQLDKFAITFNANIQSIDSGDVRAVYQTLDADPNAVRTMYKSERTALPTSNPAKYYPDTTYFAAKGFVSGAETISYYLQKDSSATTDSTYVLYRRVNATTPTIVARNIIRRDTIPFFTYYKADSLGRLITINPSLFPIYHGVIHGAASDIGTPALTDSVRVVRVHFNAVAIDRHANIKTSFNKDSLKYRVIETRIRLMNSGLLNLASCGEPPVTPATPALTQTASGVTPQSVTVTWGRSGDDGVGEKDVERYAIFRQLVSSTQSPDPISSIPASGATSYSFTDTTVLPGQSYVFGVAAQDCSPRVSSVSLSAAITINP